MKGRIPKPSTIKLLEGNRGHRPIPKDVKPDDRIPKMPAYLAPLAKTWWRKNVPALAAIGMLSSIDATALEAMASSYAIVVTAEEALAKDGHYVTCANGVLKAHPALSILRQAYDTYRRFCCEFGMTPSSRSRLTSGDSKLEEMDPAEIGLMRAMGMIE